MSTPDVGSLMSSPPVTVGHRAVVADAAKAMRAKGVGSVVVVNGTAVVGILTERDLVRFAAAGADASRSLVRAWMTREPYVIAPDTAAEAAWDDLRSRGFRHVPVVADGALVGVLSVTDLGRTAVLAPAGDPA